MADSFSSPTLEPDLQSAISLLETVSSKGYLQPRWYAIGELRSYRKDEFLLYATFFGLTKYVLASVIERKICHDMKSDILLTAVSTRVGRSPDHSVDEVRLLDVLLHKGADPNYARCPVVFFQKYRFIVSPFCGLLGGIRKICFHSAAELSIQRLFHSIDGFLQYEANTSDLVNVNISVSNSKRLRLFAFLDQFFRDWDEDRGKEEDKTTTYFFSLVPAFLLIQELVNHFGSSLQKTWSQWTCCGQDHVAAIRGRTEPIRSSVKPRVLAICNNFRICQKVSEHDQELFSNGIIEYLATSQSEDDAGVFIGILSDIYQRDKGEFAF
ncbi:hypothetical protein BX600DRAFT_949 [Xylariales sp. PMI_506]|nr:hypothetical protein BX600DRAFT_949 [Xylariales sp. PMI_506]